MNESVMLTVTFCSCAVTQGRVLCLQPTVTGMTLRETLISRPGTQKEQPFQAPQGAHVRLLVDQAEGGECALVALHVTKGQNGMLRVYDMQQHSFVMDLSEVLVCYVCLA